MGVRRGRAVSATRGDVGTLQALAGAGLTNRVDAGKPSAGRKMEDDDVGLFAGGIRCGRAARAAILEKIAGLGKGPLAWAGHRVRTFVINSGSPSSDKGDA